MFSNGNNSSSTNATIWNANVCYLLSCLVNKKSQITFPSIILFAIICNELLPFFRHLFVTSWIEFRRFLMWKTFFSICFHWRKKFANADYKANNPLTQDQVDMVDETKHTNWYFCCMRPCLVSGFPLILCVRCHCCVTITFTSIVQNLDRNSLVIQSNLPHLRLTVSD